MVLGLKQPQAILVVVVVVCKTQANLAQPRQPSHARPKARPLADRLLPRSGCRYGAGVSEVQKTRKKGCEQEFKSQKAKSQKLLYEKRKVLLLVTKISNQVCRNIQKP